MVFSRCRLAYFELQCITPGVDMSFFKRTLVFALSPLFFLVFLFLCAYAIAKYRAIASPLRFALTDSKNTAFVLLFLLIPGSDALFASTQNICAHCLSNLA